MYTALTHDIQVTALPEFRPDRSSPEAEAFFWAYTIEIANLGQRTVQLLHRHWIITDAQGRVQEVKGAGVVGSQPVLPPGETFRYTSGCPLPTPSGIMSGTFRMVTEDGVTLEIEIPAFSLDSPFARRVLN